MGRSGPRMKIALCELEKRRPVERVGVRAVVVAKGEFARGERLIRRGHPRRSKVFLPQQPVDRASRYSGQEAPVRIGPLVPRAAIQENGTRRDEGDEFVR